MERLTPSQHILLETLFHELERWNRRMNLTTVPAADVWQRHVAESLDLEAAAAPPAGGSLIDVGSGAGIPGLVVAVAREDLSVVLLEADVRKAAFLTHTAALMGLASTEVVNARAESAARRAELRETFDVALSRAAAPPAALCELALPFVRVGGRLAALVGDAAVAARDAVRAAAECGGSPPAAIGAGIFVVEKVRETPALFPRREGVPSRRPLR